MKYIILAIIGVIFGATVPQLIDNTFWTFVAIGVFAFCVACAASALALCRDYVLFLS